MKKVLLFIAVLISSQSFSQEWSIVSGADIHDVAFISKDTIVIAGSYGKILRSVDSGRSWKVVYNDVNFTNINSVSFPNSKTGYASGEYGILLKTVDAGANWSSINTGFSPAPFNDIHFINKDTGSASINNELYLSKDGGLSWVPFPSFTNTGGARFSIYDKNLFCIGNYKTMDGGFTWQSGASSYDNAVFVDPSVGFKGDNGSFFKTRNGGVTWTYLNTWPYSITDVCFTDSLIGYATTGNYGIIKTIDGGYNWSVLPGNPASPLPLYNLKYFQGVMMAYDHTENLFRIENEQIEHTLSQIHSLYLATNGQNIEILVKPDKSVIGFQGSYLYNSADGNLWKESTISGSGDYYYDIFFLDKDTGFIAAHYFYKTTDGGQTWINTNKIIDATCMVFINSQTAYASKISGSNVNKTNNQGNSWSAQSVSNSQEVRAISFPSSSTGFIISAGGKINKTVNTYSWTALTSGTTNDLNDIYFTDVNKGYVVGNSGTLLRTLNSGTTWQQASIGTSVNLNAIYFLSSDTGYVVGDLGTVLLTVNGGNLWSIVPLGLKDDLFSVHFNNGIGCIAGRNNLILKMEYNTSLPTLPPVVTSLKSTGLTEQDLNVFPNPSSGSVSLSFSSGYYSEKISYSLINEMGIEIESGEPEKNGQEYKINLQHHPKGMYFLKLISNETFGVEKIIIQ